MKTLDALNIHGEQIINKLKDGATLSKEDQAILKIYNSLYAKKSNLSGKRRTRNDQGGFTYR